MSSDKFIIKKGLKLESNSTASDADGEVRFDGTDLKFYSTTEKTLATTADITAHTGDATDAHAASAITNTPAGNIAATTVQAAIDELDSEKVAKVTSTDNAVTRFDGITGAVQDSGVTIDDSDNVIIPGDLRSDGATVDLADATTASIGTTNTATTINIGSGSGANTINIGGASSTVNITGSVNNQNVTNLNVTDKLITVNDGGAAASGGAAGLEVEEDSSITGYAKTSADRNSWEFKAPNTNGVASLTPGASADTVTLNAATQTLTNKTLTTPTTDVITLDGQASTPSNPSAGYYKLYAKDDGKVYKLNSSGTEAEIGAGGSGGINYIQQGGGNPDAEGNATTGWTAYADAAATSPVDGTGGSPTTTWTVTSTTPLRGTYSFLLTKDAANRQGEGVSYDFTIDKADKGKVLQGSFEYAVSSGTFADDDVSIWIYDVTNATLLQPAPYKLKNHSLDSEKFPFEFQTSSSSTSYRLIIHVASTSASAYTLKFDNFNVGPQAKLYGSPVTDWISWTPTSTWVSNATHTGYWRRVGDNAEYNVKVTLTGAPTAAELNLNLPSGHTIDTTKFQSTNGNSTDLGLTAILDSGTAAYTGRIRYLSTTSVSVVVDSVGGTYGTYAPVSSTVPVTFASGDVLTFNFKVPILGWSSSVIMSSDADTRVVAMRGTNNSGTTYAATGDTLVPVTLGNGNTFDTHGKLSSSIYTVPVKGKYRISASVELASGQSFTNQDLFRLYAKIDGSSYVLLGTFIAQVTQTITYYPSVSGSAEVDLNAGQTIALYTNNVMGASKTGRATSPDSNYLNISLISGPAQIAASETIAASRRGGSNTSIANGTTPVVIANMTNLLFDTHGALSTAGVFTAPIAGYYRVDCRVTWDSASFTSGTTPEFFIYVNSANYLSSAAASTTVEATATKYMFLNGSHVVYMTAGQTLDIRARHGEATARNILGSDTIITITRVGM